MSLAPPALTGRFFTTTSSGKSYIILNYTIYTCTYIEGNGNPLQYSCLENPMDRGAWWAAIYGVAQSGTWLKWLSSSSVYTYYNIYIWHNVCIYILYSISYILYIISTLCIKKWSEVKSLSRVWLFATPWTVAYQASLSMGFSRQEYWSGLPFPSPTLCIY